MRHLAFQLVTLFLIIIHGEIVAKNAPWVSYSSANPTAYGVYHFRKTFDLEKVSEKLVIHVSADNRYNRFVTLRGLCSRCVTPGSWWYLPGAPYDEIAGGPQKYDSHIKYFLMVPGLERALTIGFRCLKYN